MSPFPARQLHTQTRLSALYARVAAFKVEDLFSRKRTPGPKRTIFINENLPSDYYDAKGRVKPDHVYSSNQVITSKYTLLTFVPRNLLEQFRRVANVFFLGIAILQFFPKFSTISPGLVLLPLLIVVTITALKDGYEDIKRHQSDRKVNNTLVRILGGGDFVNPNVMQRKSKTFVRGVLRSYGRRKKEVHNSNPEGLVGVTTTGKDEERHDVEFDYDLPPGSASRRPPTTPAAVSSPTTSPIPIVVQPSTSGTGSDPTSSRGSYTHGAEASEPDLRHPHWKKIAWEDLAVGDFVKILDNESIPADILICATSGDENMCFVETKNLDGETNLKSRNAVPALTHLRTAKDCARKENVFRVDCEKPDNNMYRLDAAVRVGEGEVFAANISTVLLRGTVLRNTEWVIGLVLFTGEDTRIVLNSGGTPSKRSKVERQMNPQVFVNLSLLALMATACGVVDSILEHRDYPRGAPWLYGSNTSGDNPSINGLVTFFFALITFQNIVPISLYISIEFVKTCQAAFIYFDYQMVHKGQPALARSWNLSDDLGQVEYIFSDKTGTLTQNSMIFRKCSIGGKMYSGDEEEDESNEDQEKKEVTPTPEPDVPPPAYVKSLNNPSRTASGTGDIPLRPISGRSTVASSRLGPSSFGLGSTPSGPPPPLSSPGSPPHLSNPGSPAPPGANSGPPRRPTTSSSTSSRAIHHFQDRDLAHDLRTSVDADPNSPNAAHARQLNGFFSVLALCHTVLTHVDEETGRIEYKAQSPDEAALVQAAADMGFVFRGREREVLFLETPFGRDGGVEEEGYDEYGDGGGFGRRGSKDGAPGGGAGGAGDGMDSSVERYELLNILEFTSARKRMSVVLRKMDGDDRRLFLLTKGADNVIFERLKEGADEALKRDTEKHLDEFAADGLRTLTLAYKVISEADYNSWSERYHHATVALENRDEMIDKVSDELERDLRLLGATAIEDRLQDGVPETIADLKRAGIKIWVATGDKLETAIAIGHSTNLIGRESNIIIVKGRKDGKPVYDQMLAAVREFFPDSGILDAHGNPSTSPSLRRAASNVQEDLEDGGLPPRFTSSASMPPSGPPPPLARVNTGVSSLVGEGNGERPGGFVLVIDGAALEVALADDVHRDLLLSLAMVCEGVICCRVSPLQKALVVKLVKDGIQAMTLAIGDGANDVSMIQAADVGVGISGEEGLQAVNSSDYAIAQFRFLKRLLLVHGHWSYARNGTMILNFFYKNIVCIGVLWWFQIYCAWSSTYVLEYTYLLFWNSFWTLAPVIGIGLFDRFADDHVLMDVPELYWYGREGKWFGIGQFIAYMFDGVVQSAIIYFLILYTYVTTSARDDGWQVGMYEFSTTMVFSAAFTANMFNGLNTSAWTAWVFFAVFIGNVLIWVYTAIYNLISPGWFVTPVWGNNNFLFASAYWWLCLPLTIILSLTPRYLYKAYKFGYHPDDIDILRYIRKVDPSRDLSHDPNVDVRISSLSAFKRPRPASMISNAQSHTRTGSIASIPRPSIDLRTASRTDMSTGIRSVHRGFSFSMEEGGVAMRRIQTNLSERRQSSNRNLAAVPETGTLRKRAGTLLSALRRKGSTTNHPPPNDDKQ